MWLFVAGFFTGFLFVLGIAIVMAGSSVPRRRG